MTRKKPEIRGPADPVQIQLTISVKRPKSLTVTHALLQQVAQHWLDTGEVINGFAVDAIHWYHPETGLDSIQDATKDQRLRIRGLVRRGLQVGHGGVPDIRISRRIG